MLTILGVRIIQPSTEHLKVRTESSVETDLEIFLRFYNFQQYTFIYLLCTVHHCLVKSISKSIFFLFVFKLLTNIFPNPVQI